MRTFWRVHGLWRAPPYRWRSGSLFETFLSVCKWVDVYFGWRPNLPDEHDNHVIELAVAGAAAWIVTSNVADFKRAEPKFPEIRVGTAVEFMSFLKEEGLL